ncbi:MAG: FAD-dependent oxidoreductase [Acidobacteriota bacterium]
MSRTFDAIVVGAGIYGTTTALELHRRQLRVALLDPGPVPHPLASSTDISKVVRMEYGVDSDYMALVDESISGWHRWNEDFGEDLYHETGVSMLSREEMAPGGFEYESWCRLLERGRTPERLSADEIARRFPAWAPGVYRDGFFHARGGFAESGRVVEALAKRARELGITVIEGQTVDAVTTRQGVATGVTTREGEAFSAAEVVICAGAWTAWLLPELQAVMRSTGHPIFHLAPARPERFAAPHFAVFTADVANCGWYGFPLHPRRGVVKIANHGVGQPVDPEADERVVTAADEAGLRQFLAHSLPELVDAPIVFTRRCLYCDTLDEHLWIDRHPAIEGLTVAAGGSGHAFKMAPMLGPVIADAVLRKPNPWLAKFRWRELSGDTARQEAARYHGES